MKRDRCRENIGRGKFRIHISDAFNDGRTLCGYAYEGNPGDDTEFGVAIVARGKVDCGSCLQIIRYCKSVPARMLSRGRLEQTPPQEKK
jgi:hypothetical protein